MHHVLIFAFNLKRTAAEARQMLVEAYGDRAFKKSKCKSWYREFNDGNFDMIRKRRVASRKRRDPQLEALLGKDDCQSETLLAQQLGVSQEVVLKRLGTIGMVRLKGKWVRT